MLENVTGDMDAIVPGTADRGLPDNCRFRLVVSTDPEAARCRLLAQVFGPTADGACAVTREICTACCQSFAPTVETLNPVIASLIFARTQQFAHQETGHDSRLRWDSLRTWAEQHLEIESPGLPPLSQPESPGEHARTRPLCELLPLPAVRCGEIVRHWSVGVTTAPRRHPRLNECLRSLSAAGWPRPHLFVDGAVTVSGDASSLPMTVRDEQIGAWPNFYLSLMELLMREPLADAYLVVQDDALFYCRENIREYLEGVLWPGSRPGIVSLYCATPDARPQAGWAAYAGRWKFGAVAFVFPREIARRMLIAPPVFRHRWAEDGRGLVGICDIIGEWAEATDSPVYFPTPSLVQHIGETSAIWLGSHELTPQRRADVYVGSRAVIERSSPAPSSLAEFPESAFPCAHRHAADYRERLLRGRDRMSRASVVLCGLCRDVADQLPATIARVERLAALFADCAIVLFENDSVDRTPELLARWARENPAVHLVSEPLGQPKVNRGTSRGRTERMAYYRNRCRQHVLEGFGDRTFVLVADMDLEGGWSYDGIAHSFGHDDWDFVGSNGLWFRGSSESEARVHHDSFAFRAVGAAEAARGDEVNGLRFERGEPLVPVWSCFGGLGIYRMEGYKAAAYGGEDCEHVTFHQSLRERGYNRLFLNPSQIVLYAQFRNDP